MSEKKLKPRTHKKKVVVFSKKENEKLCKNTSKILNVLPYCNAKLQGYLRASNVFWYETGCFEKIVLGNYRDKKYVIEMDNLRDLGVNDVNVVFRAWSTSKEKNFRFRRIRGVKHMKLKDAKVYKGFLNPTLMIEEGMFQITIVMNFEFLAQARTKNLNIYLLEVKIVRRKNTEDYVAGCGFMMKKRAEGGIFETNMMSNRELSLQDASSQDVSSTSNIINPEEEEEEEQSGGCDEYEDYDGSGDGEFLPKRKEVSGEGEEGSGLPQQQPLKKKKRKRGDEESDAESEVETQQTGLDRPMDFAQYEPMFEVLPLLPVGPHAVLGPEEGEDETQELQTIQPERKRRKEK